MRCRRCFHLNRPSARFCDACGNALTQKNASVPDSTSKPLPSLTADGLDANAERRQLTVMFCDLVGSTALSERLDPEDYHDVLRAYQTVCGEVIEDFDGHIAQYLGDGLLVYFGYPLAHEDDAQRAVKTGLGILAAIKRLNIELQQNQAIELAVRLAMHTGVVIVGELGSWPRQDQLALGETLNIAARLLDLAKPNTAVITAATYQLIEGLFPCQGLGSHTLKGISKPVLLYQLLLETQSPYPLQSLSGAPTPLVNRTQELQQLQQCWLEVKHGQGQVVYIEGEPGIGKTRLISAFRASLQQETHTLLECRCHSYYAHSALHPVIELLQRMLDCGGEISTQDSLARLEHKLAAYDDSLREIAPLLEPLLSKSLIYRHTPFTLAAEQQRQKTLAALEICILALAHNGPLVFVVENLHWADPSTLELLGRLMERIAAGSTLLLLTYRPGFQLPWSTVQTQSTYLLLTRLSPSGVESIAKQVAGDHGLGNEWLDYIVAKTDGVPLFVEEFTKMVIESGLTIPANNPLMGPASLAQLAIPSTLRDSLMARLDRLASAKDVAQLGAVLGREFRYDVLRAVSPLDEAILNQELARLIQAELLYLQGAPPRTQFVFKHALIQDVAYESLLKRQRRRYHLRIAEVLEHQFQDMSATHPELLAHHYTEAGAAEKAVVYWRKASHKAISRSAYQEAIVHLEKALALFEKLPKTPQHTQQALALQTTLGTALIATKGFANPQVEITYLRALKLCSQVNASFARYQILLGLSRFYFIQGDLNTAQEIGEQLLALAGNLDDPTLPLMEGHRALGSTLLQRGEFIQARQHLEKAIILYDSRDPNAPRFLYWADPGVVCLAFAAEALWSLGYPQQALEKSTEAIAQAHALGHPLTLTHALALSAWLRRQRGEVDISREWAERIIELASEHKFLFYLATGTVLQGWAMVECGEGEQGIAQIRQGLNAYQAVGAKLMLPSGFYMLADACDRVGQRQEGLEVLTHALSLVHQHGEHFWEAELHRLKGDLLLSQSKAHETEAEACFERAIELARRQQAKSLELRATKSLSRLWCQQGYKKQAHSLLENLYGWFDEGFDTVDLRKAQALLKALEY